MSIKPAEYNFTLYQGATLTKTWNYFDTTTNQNINWTGWTAKMQMKQYVNVNDSAVLTLTTDSGIATLSSNGNVTITISASQSAAIPAGNYYYDIELTSGTTVERVASGRIQVDGQVTA
jgi:hypothetical protein